jgi:hypothetical protein
VPKENNVHEVAQRAAPESRVVYVDRDPIVLAHAHALLRGTPEGVTRYIYGELREPEAILRASAETLDFTHPADSRAPFRHNAEMAESVVLRTREQVAALFGDLESIEPGVVQLPQWHPAPDAPAPGPLPMWCRSPARPPTVLAVGFWHQSGVASLNGRSLRLPEDDYSP